MRLLAVANGKGGVGKTTTVMSLAAVLAEVSRVLVVDNDLQASAVYWAERAGERLPFDFADTRDPRELGRLRELPYDVVIVDTPGSLEPEPMRRMQLVVEQCDYVLVPTVPEALAFPEMVKTIKKVIKPAGVDYRVMLNNVDRRMPKRLEQAQALIDGAGLPRLGNYIGRYVAHSDAPLQGEVVTQYEASRLTYKAIDDYRRVGLELSALWANGAQLTEVK
jgi:chromosome partitioning protein